MATEPTEQVGTRLLFENERIRVWDFALAPGESLESHRHKLDYCFIVVSGGLLRMSDPDNPASDREIQFQDEQVRFIPVEGEGKVDHLLTNVGAKPHRNFVIEFKR